MNSSTTADWQALETYLTENGTLSWRQTLSQFHDICFALEAEHNTTGQFGDLTIRSFKLTNTADGITIEYIPNWVAGLGNRFPDEAYLSPEKCLDKKTDERSDIYSLGCIMYHCLTGSPPFMHRDREKLKEMQAVDYSLPPGRRSQKRYIPDEVDHLINTCLQKDPARRFKNAGELRAAIGNALQLEESDQESFFKGSRLTELVHNKRRLLAVVSVLMLGIGGLAWASMHTAASDEFRTRIETTNNRKRNRYFMNLEAGQFYVAQLDFGGLFEPPPGTKPLEIMVKGKDTVLFATTVRPTLKEAVLEAVRRHLMLWNADLEKIDLSGCNLANSNLEGAFCQRGNFSKANFENAHLKQINFSAANMQGANLSHANLSEAILHRTDLQNANLSGAILLNADCRGAKLRDCDLTNCYVLNGKFNGADLTNANLTGLSITKESLATATLSDQQKASVKIITGPLSAQEYEKADPDGLKVKWLKTQKRVDSSKVDLPKGPISKMDKFKLLDPQQEEQLSQPAPKEEPEESLTGLTPLEQNILKGLRARDKRKAERQQQQQQPPPQQPK